MDFRGKFLLAPMAGATDGIFRLLCREAGADGVITEMVSARGLLRQPHRAARLLEYDPREHPVGVQLWGCVPSEIEEAAARVAAMGFDFVDLNMGCPVRKVVAAGAGAALLASPPLCGALVAAAVRGARLPVTVKMRAGFAPGSSAYLEVAREAFAAGAAAVTLHPRTRGQMFSGAADWRCIARLKEAFPDRVVIGNGDVRSPEDARRMRAETGCDAVMVGRAALGNPWIFRAIKAACAPPGGDPAAPGAPSRAERKEAVLRHARWMHARYGRAGIAAMRKHLAWYSRGLPGSCAFRAELVRVDSLETLHAAVERFF